MMMPYPHYFQDEYENCAKPGLFFGHFSATYTNSELADYWVYGKIPWVFCQNPWVFSENPWDFWVIKKQVLIRQRDDETTRRDDETRQRDETTRRRDGRIVGVQNPYRTFWIFGHPFFGHFLSQSKRRRDNETTRQRDNETTRRRDGPPWSYLKSLLFCWKPSSVSSSHCLVVSSSRRLVVSLGFFWKPNSQLQMSF